MLHYSLPLIVMYDDKGGIKTNKENNCLGCQDLQQSVRLETFGNPWETFINKDTGICMDFNINLDILMDRPNNNYKIRPIPKGVSYISEEDYCASDKNTFRGTTLFGALLVLRYLLLD